MYKIVILKGYWRINLHDKTINTSNQYPINILINISIIIFMENIDQNIGHLINLHTQYLTDQIIYWFSSICTAQGPFETLAGSEQIYHYFETKL